MRGSAVVHAVHSSASPAAAAHSSQRCGSARRASNRAAAAPVRSTLSSDCRA
jgi:hypothetical protein